MSVADSNSLDLTTGMTLEAWVNPQGADWRTVLLKERPSGLAYALYSNTDTGRPSAEIRTSTPAETRGPAALPSGWSHLAATYDGATLRLYVNGTQVSSQARSGSIEVGTGAVRIGGNLVWGEYFNGLIDELRIYNRALTATEIQTDMTSPIAPTTDSQPPSAPGNLNATVNGDDVQLTWNASTDNTGVTGYRVYRSATAGFTPDAGTLIATIGAVTSYVDPDRVTGTWHYRVIAVDAAGNASATSAQASATIATAQPPSAPENLTAAVLSGDDVRLNWTASTGQAGVTSYRVYRNGTLIATRGAALPTAYDDVDVPPGTHGYTVLAVDPAGTSSAPSNEAGVTVQPDTTPPTVSVTDYGPPLCSRAVGDYVYLRPTISDDRGPVTFHLELDGATVFGPRTVLASDPLFSFTTFQEFWWDTRATPPGQHVMTAYARDGAGNEAASEPCVWTVGPLSVPITSPAAGATVSGAVLVNAQPLAGDQIPNEIDIIGVGFSVDGVSKASDDTTPYQFSWDTTKVANGVHTLKVDLYWTDNPNRPSPSVASSTIQVTVANVVPKPTGLAATVETVDDVRLTWDAADGDIVDNFKLYRSATAGFTPGADNFVRLVDGGLTSLTDADRPSGPWYYRLVAVGYGSGPANPPAAKAHRPTKPSPPWSRTRRRLTSASTMPATAASRSSIRRRFRWRSPTTAAGRSSNVVSQGRTIWSFHNPWIQGPNVRIDWWTFPGWPDGLYDVDAIARIPPAT